jgi:DNA-binding protein H-NS
MKNLELLDETELLDIEKQLSADLVRVADARERIRQQDRARDIEIIKALVKKHGMKLADPDVAAIFPSVNSQALANGVTRPKTPVTMKYRGPNLELWSGRGRLPRWLQATGRPKEEFLIPAGEINYDDGSEEIDIDEVLAATSASR